MLEKEDLKLTNSAKGTPVAPHSNANAAIENGLVSAILPKLSWG